MSSRWMIARVTFAMTAAVFCAGPWASPKAGGQTNDKAASQAPVQLSVTTNLVVVRAVVRDANGKAVEGLKKEDFKLFDRGHEQSITQFEEHSATSPASEQIPSPSQTVPAAANAPTGNFLALYFDDLYSSGADLAQARDAADRYLTTRLTARDRVAIFTSGAMLSDFTSDPKQIHEALLQLHPSPRALDRIQGCPQMSDYQASEIAATEYDPNAATEHIPNNDAWQIAMHDALQCSSVPSNAPGLAMDAIANMVRTQARNVIDQAQELTRADLQGVERAVKATAPMPGQRTVILISPGFLSKDEQAPLDRIIDQALRAQVAISALDPKGLAILMREADASQRDFGGANAAGAVSGMERTREMLATQVLQEVAQGTGGEFFHNNNDLNAGLGALAGSPTYYTLAFAPRDLKQDGKFHPLKVTLAEKQHGFRIQARRGYFAIPGGVEAAKAESKSPEAGSVTDPATHERIREALFAKNDTTQLAVKLDTKLAEAQGGTRELALSSHLDGNDLPFRKDAGNSTNTVTFVFGIFDAKGNLLSAQQRHVDLTVPDGQMASFFRAGVEQDVSFQLKPGLYRVREVVIDSAEHHMASLSRSVKIP